MLVTGINGDFLVELSLLRNDQGGEKLLSAADRPFFIGIALVEHLAGHGIDDDHRCTLHIRWLGRAKYRGAGE